MSKGQVKVIVSPSGKTKIEVSGVQGRGCLTVTKAIEKALGTVDSRELKPEYSVNAAAHSVEVEQ